MHKWYTDCVTMVTACLFGVMPATPLRAQYLYHVPRRGPVPVPCSTCIYCFSCPVLDLNDTQLTADAAVYSVGGVAMLNCSISVSASLLYYLDRNISVDVNIDGVGVAYMYDNVSVSSLVYYGTHLVSLPDLSYAREYYCFVNVTSPSEYVVTSNGAASTNIIIRGGCVL